MNKRHGEGAARFAERRRREDEAPRLNTEIPKLETLKLEVEARRSGSVVSEASHIRRIVVDNAPALFMLPCGDPSCRDGGHDITHPVMYALRAGQTTFDGEDTCHGQTGSATCSRILHYVGKATYRE